MFPAWHKCPNPQSCACPTQLPRKWVPPVLPALSTAWLLPLMGCCCRAQLQFRAPLLWFRAPPLWFRDPPLWFRAPCCAHTHSC